MKIENNRLDLGNTNKVTAEVYLDALEMVSENKSIYENISEKMKEIIEEWFIEEVVQDGAALDSLWEERDWFEKQVELAWEDDSLEKFGEY